MFKFWDNIEEFKFIIAISLGLEAERKVYVKDLFVKLIKEIFLMLVCISIWSDVYKYWY